MDAGEYGGLSTVLGDLGEFCALARERLLLRLDGVRGPAGGGGGGGGT